MANYKKINDFELVFVNESLSEKDDKDFSDFLKNHKTKSSPKSKQTQKTQAAIKPQKTELFIPEDD
jgi:hypothetical protein